MQSNRERLTIDNTASGLTAAEYASYGRANVFVELAPIRVTIDGTDPVAGAAGDINAIGVLVLAGGVIELNTRDEVRAAKFIRNTGVSAVIEVSYQE